MSQPTVSDWMRQAIETEEGDSISAGARLVHLRAKGIYTIDLSGVPPAEHETVLAELREQVRQRREAAAGRPGSPPVAPTSG